MQKIVLIQNKTAIFTLSKAQKQFNSLIKKIDAKKTLLQEWQETEDIHQEKLSGEYKNLLQEYNNYRAELVRLFDAAYEQRFFTKVEKKKIRHIINELTEDLISNYGMEELKDIYNKYNQKDFDTQDQELDQHVGQLFKMLLKKSTGIDIDDNIDISSPQKFQAALDAKMLEHQAQMEETQRLQEKKNSSRKKTVKQLAKEAKQKEEAQNISKSIQKVYRKLASLLHPDREPDENERKRKTRIMQEVNVAYEKKNLLRLLELQLELEHIDQAYLSNIAEERLVYFNKILKDQLKELEEEIMFIEMKLQTKANFPLVMVGISPKQLILRVDNDIQELISEIDSIKIDIKEFQIPENIKRFLKEYKITK